VGSGAGWRPRGSDPERRLHCGGASGAQLACGMEEACRQGGSWRTAYARRDEARRRGLPLGGLSWWSSQECRAEYVQARDGMLCAKSFAGDLAGADGGGALGRRFSPLGMSFWSLILTARGSLGGNFIQILDE
jgi:hypothetical protein